MVSKVVSKWCKMDFVQEFATIHSRASLWAGSSDTTRRSPASRTTSSAGRGGSRGASPIGAIFRAARSQERRGGQRGEPCAGSPENWGESTPASKGVPSFGQRKARLAAFPIGGCPSQSSVNLWTKGDPVTKWVPWHLLRALVAICNFLGPGELRKARGSQSGSGDCGLTNPSSRKG